MSTATDFSPLLPHYTVAQIAAFLGVKPRTVKTLIRSGRLGCIHISARICRITAEQFNAYIATQETQGSCPTQHNDSNTQAIGSCLPRPGRPPTTASAGTIPRTSNAALEQRANEMLEQRGRRS
jgi:excisionase family DNA binding protein